MKEQEQVIRDIINSIYNKCYTGKLKVTELKVCGRVYGYKLSLGLNRDERPLTFACDGTWELFVKYVELELHSRDLARTEYFTAILLYPELN